VISSLADKIADPNGVRGDENRTAARRGSDPDEFFQRFPGGFLFFPVVTSSGGLGSADNSQ